MKKLIMIIAITFLGASLALANGTEPEKGKDNKGEKPKKGQAVTKSKKSGSYLAYNHKLKGAVAPIVVQKETISVAPRSNDFKKNNHKLHKATHMPSEAGSLVMREKGESTFPKHINHNRKFAKSH
ncbi:hypothetical protein R9C00_22440 [Flammeovirgaceae bacterium SG7u.111]|nr:hypothetical protein [Flammeovirgaceae bacterium SG7u.132]WPO34463.1 hypothetical protein R9C00_22440 [Flammeovirgaceae bacterium SG7u.111]